MNTPNDWFVQNFPVIFKMAVIMFSRVQDNSYAR